MKEEPPVPSAEVALHNGDVRYWRKADMHRTRQLLVRQRTMLSNALRGHLAELGIVSAKGRNGISQLLGIITDVTDNRVAPAVRNLLDVLARNLAAWIGWCPSSTGSPPGDGSPRTSDAR